MNVRYTYTAIAEVEQILSYISKHNPRAAIAVKSQVEHTIGLIAEFPEIGPVKYQRTVRMLPIRR